MFLLNGCVEALPESAVERVAPLSLFIAQDKTPDELQKMLAREPNGTDAGDAQISARIGPRYFGALGGGVGVGVGAGVGDGERAGTTEETCTDPTTNPCEAHKVSKYDGGTILLKKFVAHGRAAQSFEYMSDTSPESAPAP